MKKSKKNNNKKNKIILIVILLIVLLLIGGTIAWWRWTSDNNTIINLTIEGANMTIDCGGDIEEHQFVPTDECNGNKAIVKTCIVTVSNDTYDSLNGSMYLDVTDVDEELLINNMKYTWSKTQECNVNNPTGSFETTTTDSKFPNKKLIELTLDETQSIVTSGTSNLSKSYYLYIWLNNDENGNPVSEQNKIANITFKGKLAQ